MGHRRRADPHVHFCGTSFAERHNKFATGCSPHNGIVNHNHALARKHIRQWIELHANSGLPHGLGGLNKGSAHVAILDQTIGIGIPLT